MSITLTLSGAHLRNSYFAKLLMRFFTALALMLLCGASWANITVTDDAGKTVTLKAPAKRILSLAPHVTELLYAAGAGHLIVGTVEFSDFPEAARKIPRIGNHDSLDLERIVALKPDLVVVWLNGNSQKQLDLVEQGLQVVGGERRRDQRQRARQPHRVVKGVPIRHQRGRRQNALRVGFHNPRVHIARESKIIRVDDQAFQNSLS